MSNNVVRSLNRPCALAQWRSPSTHTAARRCYSDETEETSPVSRSKASREENLHLLRVADQKYLREAKGQTNDLINKVQKVKDTSPPSHSKFNPTPTSQRTPSATRRSSSRANSSKKPIAQSKARRMRGSTSQTYNINRTSATVKMR